MPTYNVFKGDAQAVAQVTRLTIANAEPRDIFTVSINGKAVSATTPDEDDWEEGETADDAAYRVLLAALEDAIQDIPEFGKLSFAIVDSDDDGHTNYLEVTGSDDGEPFTLVLSTTNASNYPVRVSTIQEATAGQNEIQTVTLPGPPTGGTFTLTFQGQTTGAVAYNAAAATLQTALEALSNIAPGDVIVSGSAGGPWTVEFDATYAETDVGLMTANGSSLTGAGSVTIATTTGGASGTNEIQELDTSAGSSGLQDYTISVISPVSGIETIFSAFWGESAATMKSRFEVALSSEGVLVDVTLTAEVYRITFRGGWAGLNVAEMTIPASDFSITVTTVQNGSATGTDEIQTVTINNGPTGGTFTLTFEGQTTAGIAYNATAGAVESALEALSNVTDVTVTKSSNVYTVTFVDPGDQDVSQMTADASGLTGATPTIATTQTSQASINEKQHIEIVGEPAGGTFTLTFDGETTGAIAYNASAATVQTALEGLATPVAGDALVTGSAGGPWTVEFAQNYAGTDVSTMTGNGASITGANTQTLTQSTTTNPTGPSWADEDANWTLALADDQTLVLENSDVALKWGLSLASITPEAIYIKASYAGTIGLPRVHEDGYYEYRETELRIGTDGDGSSDLMTIEIGQGEGQGSGLIRINSGDKNTRLTVHHTATSTEGNVPALNWRGTHASSVIEVYRGHVGIAYFEGQAATVATLYEAFRTSQDTDATVEIGRGVTLGAISKTGGSLTTLSGATGSVYHSSGEMQLLGGSFPELELVGGETISSTSGTLGKYGTITGITAANPAVVTSASHGLSTGDKVRIAGVVGMTELNQREFTIEVVNANSFKMVGEDSSAYTAYSSGGTWGKLESVIVAGDAELTFDRLLGSRSVAVAIDVYGDEATVRDSAKQVTTTTYLSGEFAIHFHRTTRYPDLGSDVILVRR